jgi:hypothetical protein
VETLGPTAVPSQSVISETDRIARPIVGILQSAWRHHVHQKVSRMPPLGLVPLCSPLTREAAAEVVLEVVVGTMKVEIGDAMWTMITEIGEMKGEHQLSVAIGGASEIGMTEIEEIETV